MGIDKTKVKQRLYTHGRFVDAGRKHFGLTTAAHHVWLILWRHADLDGYCTLSHSRIAESTGLCLRTVIRCIQQLIEKKAIIRVVQGTSKKGVSLYRLQYFEKSQ